MFAQYENVGQIYSRGPKVFSNFQLLFGFFEHTVFECIQKSYKNVKIK